MSTIVISNIKATGETASRAVSGVAAAWVDYKGTSPNAIMDSSNISSVTDNGTGDYTMTFANAMASANYCLTDGAERLENNNSPSITGFETTSSTSYIHNHWNSGFSVSDMFRTYSQASGDLA